MVVKEILEIGRNRLKNLKYADPIKESIYIFSKVLDVDKSFLYTNLDKNIGKEKEEEFLNLIERRALGEPISYIFKSKEFMGIDFFVEKGVLIPRPETEGLVEYIINYIEEKYKEENREEKIKILEIGVGTGAISLSLGKICKATEILGIDVDDTAIKVANTNLDRLRLENVFFKKSDLFEEIKKNERFSIIVSNPPYIQSNLIDGLQIDVKNFEPRLALDGGDDGLEFYRKISKDGKKYLLPGGMLIYEIGFDQGETVKGILLKEGFKDVSVIKDFQELDRIVLGFKK